MKTVNVSLIFILILCSNLTFSQNESFLIGRIFDAKTESAIPFVTITIKEKQLGVIANAEGDFRIKLNSVSNTDTLVLTCIGYSRKAISVADARKDEVNRILLYPRTIEIGEVEVKAKRKKISASQILSKAIRNIPNNCSNRAFNYVAYYRGYQKREKEYMNMNEALIQSFDNGIASNPDLIQYRMLDFRINEQFDNIIYPELYFDGTLPENNAKMIPGAKLPAQGGNELFILMSHDAIRKYKHFSYSFIDTLELSFLKNHYFEQPQLVYNHDLTLYKIEFQSKKWKTSKSIYTRGTVYIEPGNFAIHKIDYSGYYAESNKRMFNVVLEYGRKEVGSLMYLKYISFNNMFIVDDPDDYNCFSVEKAYVDTTFSKKWLVFEMNKNVNPQTVSNKNNYSIVIGGKKVRINSISSKGNKIFLRLKYDQLDYSDGQFEIKNVQDKEGRVVNVREKLEIFQYRELFVQEYDSNVRTNKDCYLKNETLRDNCVSSIVGKNKYWMNSPLADEEK